jgi:hypothetical protein
MLGRPAFSVHDSKSTRSVPVQCAVLDRWPDASARWLLCDFQADATAPQELSLHLDAEDAATAPPMGESRGDGVAVHTGVAEFHLSPRRFPFERVLAGGRPALDAEASALLIEDGHGQHASVSVSSVTLETNGPIRATVRVEGVAATRRHTLAFVARLHFFAGLPSVRFDLALRNPRAARHPGGIWELGDAGSALIADVTCRFALPNADSAPTVLLSLQPDEPLRRSTSPMVVYQESSGGEYWRSPAHVNRAGTIPMSRSGYVLDEAGHQSTGSRATPLVWIETDEGGLGVTMEHFWEVFPKSIEVAGHAIDLHLFPRRVGDLHEIQGGEQKTHTFWLSFGGRDAAESLARRRTPASVTVDPAWACATGAVPFLTPRTDDPNQTYLQLVDSAIRGADSFEAKRERIDEYGWRHFGEVYADHEATLHTGADRLVSHYNNQYDPVAGMLCQWLRSGDPAWWPLADQLATHVVDIDIYHTDEDWPKYNHGLFWHTVHYIDAGKSTHRTYPRAERVHGGGPTAGHLYTTGLMLHHFATGSAASREAVIELATFVVDSDDPRASIFKWLDRGPTGYISASAPDYHGPGRAPGNALNALVDGHRLTGDQRFLAKAEELIRRCIHPADRIADRQLLDVERRWFYTMFLQSLGKYLLHKQELDQCDAMFAYGRASLLAYARWMADHEQPYLDRPEILEYPNETWAAQDMRKSEVFKWAAWHAADAERARFLERARFFFDQSVRTLSSMETRTLARPVVLMLSFGWSQPAFEAALPPAVPCTADFSVYGSPTVFVPQRVRAIRRAKLLLAAGVAVGAAAAIVVGIFAFG